MKLSAFEKVIRKVVREEIDYALRREIALLKENLTTNNRLFTCYSHSKLESNQNLRFSWQTRHLNYPQYYQSPWQPKSWKPAHVWQQSFAG